MLNLRRPIEVLPYGQMLKLGHALRQQFLRVVKVITSPDWLQLVLKCSELYDSHRLDENSTKNCRAEF